MKAIQLAPAEDSEDLARAELYGLLARLFQSAPDEDLWAQLQVAVTEAPVPGAFLESSWHDLVAAARRLERAQVEEEYADLFIGVGKPEIFLSASWHLTGALNEKPLAALRGDLQALGLERPEHVTETEDHIAALCEVMRFLIAGEDVGISNLGAQQRFYNAHLRGWVGGCCELLITHPRADFYRAVASFARDFFAVESQGLDLLDT